jgi:predicted transcriptional regulator
MTKTRMANRYTTITVTRDVKERLDTIASRNHRTAPAQVQYWIEEWQLKHYRDDDKLPDDNAAVTIPTE